MARARADGVDVRGYLHWSAFDNFEWSEGYRPRFGLIAIDHTNNLARVPKPSAYTFASIARGRDLLSVPLSDNDATQDE
jgi:beta-glucosidase